jgi:hypothetical protein
MLDPEREYFAAHQEELVKNHPGQFVLIKGDQLIGAFGTMEEALELGARKYGLEPFLVRNVNQMADQEMNIPALTLGILRADSSRPVQPGTRK